MELEGKKVLVVGLGKTGEALVRFLLRRGAKVMISEKKTEKELGRKVRFWMEKGVPVETGRHRLRTFLEAELIIPSPGVVPLPELESARLAGVKILSEIELAYHFLRGTIVGITGTNGKSTTATLTYHILKNAGFKARLAGNIGTPLIAFTEKSREDHIYVTEVSSFQLEYIERFRAPISIFLNISANHLDWHPSFEDYIQAKRKLVWAQKKGDTAILNRDDPLVWAQSKKLKARVYSFSTKRETRRGCFLKGVWIILRDDGDQKILRRTEIPLPGLHNVENVMASILASHQFAVSPRVMRRSIEAFAGLEHRLEKVLSLRRVDFINDSKATTVDATLKALQSFDRTTILILGGRDKGADFTPLRKALRKKVKKVILLGEAKNKIRKSLSGAVRMEEASTLREAVNLSYAAAAPGDLVLLAPACTSFDMFKNFEDRGRAFKREVRRLEKTVSRGRA